MSFCTYTPLQSATKENTVNTEKVTVTEGALSFHRLFCCVVDLETGVRRPYCTVSPVRRFTLMTHVQKDGYAVLPSLDIDILMSVDIELALHSFTGHPH
jgi:hypothetical protein